MTRPAACIAHLLATARTYDRTDPDFAARMRDHADAIERRVVPEIPSIPDDAEVVS